MQKSKKISSTTKKKLIFALSLLLILLGILFALEKRDVINLLSTEKSTSTDTAKTTSTVETAQENFTEGNERDPGNSLNENEGSGGITDNNGVFSPATDTSEPIISSTGEISVYSPKNNALITTGHEVSGSSTLPKVTYRLIDDVSGVIAMGELGVVNGKFSGFVSYVSSGKNGRLDIYATKADGSEFSNIEILLRLN
jgi:hypothetical protein